MLATFLLFVMLICIPAYPVIAALAFSGAVWSAKSWSGRYEDVFVMVIFYGALAGIITVWFQR